MKTIKYFATLLMMFAFTASLNAQVLTKDQEKAVKKEVKAMEKEGWKVKPGSLSLADQIIRSKQAENELNADDNEKWIIGLASSVGTIYDAARTQAFTVAQGEIARRLKTDMTSQIESNLGNDQLAQNGAESVAQVIVTSMGKSIDQTISRPRTLMECYRDLPNGNVEVLMRLAISADKRDALVKAGVERARSEYLRDKVEEVKSKIE